ncbi:MAG: SpoIIE family protein phosphatase [Melioribacteraceae bacterium]|nr:SpoIIE family protein phosphatase [Melioribacteraceae bacterium]
MNDQNTLEKENQRLKNAVEELAILNEIAIAVSSTQSLKSIINLIVNKCVKHLKVEQAVVMLLDEKDANKPFQTMIRKQDSIAGSLPFRFDALLTGWMLKNKSPLLINNLKEDSRFKLIGQDTVNINSLLSVPLFLKGKMLGLLTVFNKKSDQDFTAEDQKLLAIIAAQSAHVIENARLHEEEHSFFKLREEMRFANEIQVNLLPKSSPEIPNYQISGKSIPAKDVGGDYFDFIQIDDDNMAFCLGDISGKGIPAALLMANLQATLRGQSILNYSCKDCISFSNKLLYRNTDSQKYATLFYGILNHSNNKITYCNAGHNNPILISNDKKVQRLDVGGIVVGIMPEYPFQETSVNLNPGDLLVLFSDGITEAMNESGEEFEEEKLINLLLELHDRSTDEIIDTVLKSVNDFSGNSEPMDDKTIVVVKYKN